MMKKIFALILLAAMLLTLCACGGKNDPAPTPVPTPEDVPASVDASNSDAATNAQTHQPPASSTDTTPAAGANEDAFAAAQACIGQPVETLYAAVGQPNEEPQYATSCLQDGAEDGMLYYDGFYVWTVRTETEELVHAVEVWS